MRKPEITPGEWKLNLSLAKSEVVTDDTIVVWCVPNIHDVKAISAVPDMIDALVVAYKQVLGVCEHNERLNNGIPSELDRADLNQIEQSLIKAGVEL